jgi:hypothetical protein
MPKLEGNEEGLISFPGERMPNNHGEFPFKTNGKMVIQSFQPKTFIIRLIINLCILIPDYMLIKNHFLLFHSATGQSRCSRRGFHAGSDLLVSLS